MAFIEFFHFKKIKWYLLIWFFLLVEIVGGWGVFNSLDYLYWLIWNSSPGGGETVTNIYCNLLLRERFERPKGEVTFPRWDSRMINKLCVLPEELVSLKTIQRPKPEKMCPNRESNPKPCSVVRQMLWPLDD